MNDTLNQIKKNLYEIENILSTPVIVKLLNDNELDSQNFLKIINLYIERFDELKSIDDIILLDMLNEKLSYFAKNSQNKTKISLYHTQLATSITFIQDKAKIFFKNSNTHTETARVKKDINLPLKSIEIKDFYSIQNLMMNELVQKRIKIFNAFRQNIEEHYEIFKSKKDITRFLPDIDNFIKACDTTNDFYAFRYFILNHIEYFFEGKLRVIIVRVIKSHIGKNR